MTTEPEKPRSHTEQIGITCTAHTNPKGGAYLRIGGGFFPSLPNVYFYLQLDTTLAHAEALATQINEQEPTLIAQHVDQEMDGLLLNFGKSGLTWFD
jgi:hypothetical protein